MLEHIINNAKNVTERYHETQYVYKDSTGYGFISERFLNSESLSLPIIGHTEIRHNSVHFIAS